MPTNFTVNKGLYQVQVGTEQDTWGPFLNFNADVLDGALGGVGTVALTNVPVTLLASQYVNNFLTFTGAITGNVTVTLPSVGSFYTAQNLTSNTSNFNVTLTTTAVSGEHVALPWGEAIDVLTDGVNVRFRNFGRVGGYIDIASSTIPSWITACSVPPYLLCNGSSFNTTTYPILARMLAGGAITTGFLPDFRGRLKFSIDPTGFSGTPEIQTYLNSGGNQATTIGTANMPLDIGPEIDPTRLGGGSGLNAITVTSVTAKSNIPPAIAAGITVIRAG